MSGVSRVSVSIHHAPRAHHVLELGKGEPLWVHFRLSMDKVMSMLGVIPWFAVCHQENIVFDPADRGRTIWSFALQTVDQWYRCLLRPVRSILFQRSIRFSYNKLPAFDRPSHACERFFDRVERFEFRSDVQDEKCVQGKGDSEMRKTAEY